MLTTAGVRAAHHPHPGRFSTAICPMRVLSFGSINIDTVFHVPHLVGPGATIAASSVERFAGGKGANQSVALARAAIPVFHAGRIGQDGLWVRDLITACDVDTSLVVTDTDHLTGSAFIQVDGRGENAIVLDAGANHAITSQQIESTFAGFARGDVLVLQNEVNAVPAMIESARRRGMQIAFSAAPMNESVCSYPLDDVDYVFVNETEAELLSGRANPEEAARALPGRTRVITQGAKGAIAFDGSQLFQVPAPTVQVVDTTAAGDTFVGYCLSACLRDTPLPEAVRIACHAAALSVSRRGAMSSIPSLDEVRSRCPT